jgi:iron complex transport system ATP-binding protein
VIRPEVLREIFHIAAEVVVEPHTKRPVCVFYNLIRDKENDNVPCGH